MEKDAYCLRDTLFPCCSGLNYDSEVFMFQATEHFFHVQEICCFNMESGEGNGPPLQYSCLENSMDGGAWWAVVHGVSKSHDWVTSLSCIGEGNGNPLQRFCLENPRDGGAWWAAIYGVAQSRTRLKRLSSNSNMEKRILLMWLY